MGPCALSVSTVAARRRGARARKAKTHTLEESVGHVLKVGRREAGEDLHLGARELLDDEAVVCERDDEVRQPRP